MSIPHLATLRARLVTAEALIPRIAAELRAIREQIHACTPELAARRLPTSDQPSAIQRITSPEEFEDRDDSNPSTQLS